MSNKHKVLRTEREQRKQQAEQAIEEALRFSRKRFKRFDNVIELLYSNTDLTRYHGMDARIRKLKECFTRISGFDRKLFKNVLLHLQEHSSLTSGEDPIQAVYNIVQVSYKWRNDIFKWKPVSKQATVQVQELTSYLFCKYPVPDFLYKAFYEVNNHLPVHWFIHIGTGGRVKDLLKVPIRFTQKMGHYFLQAPSKMNVQEALRWAQVKGLGGDEKLAERVAYSWMGQKSYSDEDFWESFLVTLINGGMFNLTKLGELIDYVRETKRMNAGYSLKGRPLSSLLRQSDHWHKIYAHRGGVLDWKSCGLPGFKIRKKNETIVLQELIGFRELVAEGNTMKHCVASYSHQCARGNCAIFSFRKYVDGIEPETLATIEVNLPTKRIVQAKAKMNRAISGEVRRYMETWARDRGLSISPYL